MKGSKNTVTLVNIYNLWRGPSIDKRVPLGMLYLGGSLKRAGYSVQAFHILEEESEQYLNRIEFDDTLFIAVTSIMTGYSLRAAITFSQRLRSRHPEIPIIWGGVQPSAIPEICLREDFVDGIGMGEGENTIIEIAKAYQGQMDFSEIKGYAYKSLDKEIIINAQRELIDDLDSFFPDYSLIRLENYIFNQKNITGLTMSSRGCPYNCSFCYNNSFNKRRWRAHSEEFVLETILQLKKRYHFSNISFSDDNFMANKERGLSILRKLRDAGIRVYSIDLRIKGLSDEDAKELNESEVISIFFGTESLNDRLLKFIQKDQNKEDVINGLVRLDRFPNMNVQTEILIGLPFESHDEMIQDIQDGFELYKYHRNLSLYFGVLFPLPRTQMFEYAKRNGFSPSSLQHFVEIDLTNAWRICDRWLPWMNERIKKHLFWTERYSELIQLNRVKEIGFLNYLHQSLNRIQFSVAKFRLIRQMFLGSRFEFFLHQNEFHFRKVFSQIKRSGKEIIKRRLPIDEKVNYRNFGYIPTGSLKDSIRKFTGHVNFLKRLQAKDVMTALDIQQKDFVLDFGCGSGYFTVEMAKLAHRAYGIDITSYLRNIKVPFLLRRKLSFVVARGERLPFRDNTFDKILASEILPMIEEPREFLFEMKRALKKGGRLVICNGAGHPSIKWAYQRKNWILNILRKIYKERVPLSYEEYCSILQASFGTCRKTFFEKEDLSHLLQEVGFELESMTYSPSFIIGWYISWSQFLLFLRKGKTLSQKYFHFLYPIASLINRLEKSKYEGGLICTARRN